jgi:predicted nucleotidyltransferase
MSDTSSEAHEQAFRAFAQRAENSLSERIHELILFGSAARGEARGIDSDVDVFVVLNSEEHREYEDELREIAYDIQLEYGVVLSLHTKTKERFEGRKDHPFVRNVLAEGRSYG